MSTGRRRAGTIVAVAGIGAVVILVALVAGPGREGPPLDPRSTGPDGTKALVDSLEELGARVRLASAPDAEDAVALLLTDTLDEQGRARLDAWVRRGGLLVVADPISELTPEPVAPASVAGIGQVPVDRRCAVEALAGVDEVTPGGTGMVMEVPAGSVGCFPRNDGHWLVLSERGEGTVVALGGPEPLVNARLSATGHAELVGALLVPRDGGDVAFLRPARPGEGEAGLADLLPDSVRFGLLQLALAFVLVVAWRARRLGRPVVEDQPVELPGSELVSAVGNLLQQTGSRAKAAAMLRRDVRRSLAERLGAPPSLSPEELAALVAARAGMPARDVERSLVGAAPTSDADLVALAASLERVRQTILWPGAGPDERGIEGAHHEEGLLT